MHVDTPASLIHCIVHAPPSFHYCQNQYVAPNTSFLSANIQINARQNASDYPNSLGLAQVLSAVTQVHFPIIKYNV